MAPNEPFLKDYICEVCHVAILQDHPEEKFQVLNYKKCNTCGFVKQLPVKNNPQDKILYGRDK